VLFRSQPKIYLRKNSPLGRRAFLNPHFKTAFLYFFSLRVTRE
jgi:hypothetical protein